MKLVRRSFLPRCPYLLIVLGSCNFLKTGRRKQQIKLHFSFLYLITQFVQLKVKLYWLYCYSSHNLYKFRYDIDLGNAKWYTLFMKETKEIRTSYFVICLPSS